MTYVTSKWDSAEYAYYYEDYDNNGWSWFFDKGYETKITVTGEDVRFCYKNVLGNDVSPYKKKNIKVYGSIPSNEFEPANVLIDDFDFDVPEEAYYYDYYSYYG